MGKFIPVTDFVREVTTENGLPTAKRGSERQEIQYWVNALHSQLAGLLSPGRQLTPQAVLRFVGSVNESRAPSSPPPRNVQRTGCSPAQSLPLILLILFNTCRF